MSAQRKYGLVIVTKKEDFDIMYDEDGKEFPTSKETEVIDFNDYVTFEELIKKILELPTYEIIDFRIINVTEDDDVAELKDRIEELQENLECVNSVAYDIESSLDVIQSWIDEIKYHSDN